MPRIAGVITKKNIKGELTHVTIDVKKHKDSITPFLEKLGITTKTQFQKDREGGLTIEEARARSHKAIDDMFLKKRLTLSKSNK